MVIHNQGLVECIYLLVNRVIPTLFCHVFLCSSTLATQMYFGRLWSLLTCILFLNPLNYKIYTLTPHPPAFSKILSIEKRQTTRTYAKDA